MVGAECIGRGTCNGAGLHITLLIGRKFKTLPDVERHVPAPTQKHTPLSSIPLRRTIHTALTLSSTRPFSPASTVTAVFSPSISVRYSLDNATALSAKWEGVGRETATCQPNILPVGNLCYAMLCYAMPPPIERSFLFLSDKTSLYVEVNLPIDLRHA